MPRLLQRPATRPDPGTGAMVELFRGPLDGHREVVALDTIGRHLWLETETGRVAVYRYVGKLDDPAFRVAFAYEHLTDVDEAWE